MKHFATLFTCLMATSAITFAQDKKDAPPPPPIKIDKVRFVPPVTEMNEFYKRNPSVAEIYRNSKQNFVVRLKNNTKEEYNLADEKEKTAFTEKYGNPPASLPPPPPPKPKKSQS